jgi:hypothetical protein
VTSLTAQAIQNAGGTVSTAAQAVQQAASVAGTTTINPVTGLTTVTPTGQSPAVTAASNDNATLAASIAQSFAQQTAELKIPSDRVALFTSAQGAQMIQQAFTGLESRTSSDGSTTFTVRPVVDTLTETNRKLDTMINLLGIQPIRAPGQVNPPVDRPRFEISARSLRNARSAQ